MMKPLWATLGRWLPGMPLPSVVQHSIPGSSSFHLAVSSFFLRLRRRNLLHDQPRQRTNGEDWKKEDSQMPPPKTLSLEEENIFGGGTVFSSSSSIFDRIYDHKGRRRGQRPENCSFSTPKTFSLQWLVFGSGRRKQEIQVTSWPIGDLSFNLVHLDRRSNQWSRMVNQMSAVKD